MYKLCKELSYFLKINDLNMLILGLLRIIAWSLFNLKDIV